MTWWQILLILLGILAIAVFLFIAYQAKRIKDYGEQNSILFNDGKW